MKYRAIFFDLDNTLLDFDRSEYNAIRRVLTMHGLPSDDAAAATYSAVNKSFWEAFERGEIPREAIFEGRFQKLLELLHVSGDSKKMSEDYFVCLSEGHDVIEDAPAVLRKIRELGIAVYATTNGICFTQRKRIRESGLEPLFNGVFISEEIGVQKPERAYFEYVLAHIPPEQRRAVLVVGDSQSSDMLGARNAHLDCCWYNPKHLPGAQPVTYEIDRLGALPEILIK